MKAEDSKVEKGQFVKFSFYRVDRAWLRLADTAKASCKRELISVICESTARLPLLKCYSLVGLRADVDFMFWLVADSLEDVQDFARRIMSTSMGSYIAMPYSYLSMTKESEYFPSRAKDSSRIRINPVGSKYLFIYPFTKKREWYSLNIEDRQRMMIEHFRTGHKYPSVKINTSYSFGLDDYEFVLAFESDHPREFLDLVMELRSSEASRYTQIETPIFSCIAVSPEDMVRNLGG